MKKIYYLVFFLLFSLVTEGCTVKSEKSGIRPNIIFIVTDDQHRHEFNFLLEGRNEKGESLNLTPTIDRLAAEGIILDQCYVSTSVCTPSRFSILTGRFASRAVSDGYLKDLEKHGQANVHWNTKIIPGQSTIASILRNNGYFTGAVGKNHVIEAKKPHRIKRNADPGLEDIRRKLEENQEAQISAYKAIGFDFAASIYSGNLPNSYPAALEHHNLDWIVKGALDFLDLAQDTDKPFFLYFATTISHGPHKLGTKYLGDPRATAAGFLDKPLDVMPSRESIRERIESAGLREQATDVLWLDDGISALIKKLEEQSKLENTVIFFIDDHGVESGKGSLYQGGIYTPAFVWGPGFIKGERRSSQPVANIDLLPTVLEISGLSTDMNPDGVGELELDGRSMLPLLMNPDHPVHSSLYFEIGATRAVIKGDYKYLVFRIPDSRREEIDAGDQIISHICDQAGGRGSEQPAIHHYPNYFDADQLYNIMKDPLERNNLADDSDYMDILEDLKQELIMYLNDLPGTYGEFRNSIE